MNCQKQREQSAATHDAANDMGPARQIRDAYPDAQRTFEMMADYQNHGRGIGTKFPPAADKSKAGGQ